METELQEKELKKISRIFKIPEKTLIDFLHEEERKDKLEDLKKRVIESGEKAPEGLVKAWQEICRTWSEFEEFFVVCEPSLKQEKFFLAWLRSASYYKEKREIYKCLEKDSALARKFLTTWIEESNIPEDLQEAISHVEKDDELYKKGLSKVVANYSR